MRTRSSFEANRLIHLGLDSKPMATMRPNSHLKRQLVRQQRFELALIAALSLAGLCAVAWQSHPISDLNSAQALYLSAAGIVLFCVFLYSAVSIAFVDE